MALIVKKLNDSVSASGGPSGRDTPPGQKPGISVTKIGGGGGPGIQQGEQPEGEKKSQQAQLREQRINQQLAQQKAEEEQRRAQESARERTYETSTGTYEKGGAIIQETKGKYETLQTLQSQQLGSALVQNQSGEYVLIRSNDLNLAQESTIENLNKNLGLEGGEPYHVVERKQKEGGTLYTPRLVESVGVKSNIGGLISGPGVSEGQGKAYHIYFEEGGRPKKEETISFIPSARQQAEAISRGESKPYFIGYQGPEARKQILLSLEEQGNKEQVFPITYTNESGKEIVTITGKSKNAEFNIYQKPVESPFLLFENKSPIIPIAYGPQLKPEKQGPLTFQEEQKKAATETYLSLGANIVKESFQFGVPEYTKPITEKVAPYEKETASDLLFQPERYNELNLQNPKVQGSLLAYGSTIFIPGRKLPRVPRFGFQSEKSKVSELAYEHLKEPKKITGTEKIAEKAYIISKGTENKPAEVPLTLVEFGKKSTVTEIYPERHTLSPAEINIQGNLYPKFQKDLEAKKIAPFTYKTEKPSTQARQTYNVGALTGGVKQIAAGRKTAISNILNEKSAKLYESSKASKIVYSQTQAEKYRAPKNPLVPNEYKQKGLRPFEYGPEEIKTKVGAGQSARGFTPQETETVKGLIIAGAKSKEKQREDFLGTINAQTTYQSSQEVDQLLIQYPPNTKSLTGLESKTSQKNILGEKLSIGSESRQLNEQATKLTERTIQKTQFKQIERMEQIPRLSLRPAQTTRQTQAVSPRLKQKTLLRQRLELTPEIPIIPKEKIPPRIPLFFLPKTSKRRKTQESLLGSTKEFLGNVPQRSIIGVYKRPEVTYGDKRIQNLLGYERRGNKPKGRRKTKAESYTGFKLSKKNKGFLF